MSFNSALGGQCVINFALGGQCVINFALGGQCFVSLPSVGSVLFTLGGEHVLPSVGSTCVFYPRRVLFAFPAMGVCT